ncbi:Heavy metal transport/detoxification protein [Geobacter metallireducens RCH3]|uniref:Heavy metal transport/detoxification domain protein n=1 Tax=Geobacter metallireducens (strain ATCC 53774 / DSM 7210 / GS-15) TaxID=269799 RepID=Q39VD5_GEOMG|nr:heavy metal-associated domain-containing protein [Geobacter metallireducens]ABB31789.1 heavy metal transport/detoxification domain protein [Geobacter metallireducens GS-15]EHP89333.1 Heavy metal transport/detoxification protein [Geobacter metallireducens RCH3]
MRRGQISKIFRLVMVAALGVVLGAGAALSSGSPEAVTELKSTGISCGGCVSKITKSLETVPGVASVDVNIEAGLVSVWHDNTATPQKLAATVSDAGYQSTVQETMSADSYREKTRMSGPTQARSGGCGCCDKSKKPERN